MRAARLRRIAVGRVVRRALGRFGLAIRTGERKLLRPRNFLLGLGALEKRIFLQHPLDFLVQLHGRQLQ